MGILRDSALRRHPETRRGFNPTGTMDTSRPPKGSGLLAPKGVTERDSADKKEERKEGTSARKAE